MHVFFIYQHLPGPKEDVKHLRPLFLQILPDSKQDCTENASKTLNTHFFIGSLLKQNGLSLQTFKPNKAITMSKWHATFSSMKSFCQMISTFLCEERCGSVVEFLTGDRGVVGSRLAEVTSMCPFKSKTLYPLLSTCSTQEDMPEPLT